MQDRAYKTGAQVGTGADRDPAAVAAAIAREFRAQPGALLPILHRVQETLGWVPPAAIPAIARELNLSRAEVHGVVTFYHHFRTSPPGRKIVQICRAEACQSRGAEALLRHVRERLGCSEASPTSSDGAHTVEAVYCLGLCASSPAALIDERPHARLDAARLDALLGSEGVAG